MEAHHKHKQVEHIDNYYRHNDHEKYNDHGYRKYHRESDYRRRYRVEKHSPFRQRSIRHRTQNYYSRDYTRSRHRHYRSRYCSRSHRRGYNNHSRKSDHDRESHKLKKESKDDKDEINHFKWDKGMELGKRYIVKSKMGDGTFGRVLYCLDKQTDKFVAIKVVRDVKKYVSSAKIEASILLDIKKLDPEGNSKCVILHDTFYHGRHICLVFEVLGSSLYDFLLRNDFKGYFIRDIQEIARQSLQSLAFLRKAKIIHTDLKPENILLTCGSDEYEICKNPRSKFRHSSSRSFTKRPASVDIKIIDFGSAIYVDEYHSPLINTRQYRSPEVILGIGWSFASDIWSLGCILIELYTGALLFGTHDHLEHLAMIERILGRIPEGMLKDASKTPGVKYLNADCTGLNWPRGAKSSSSIKRVKDCEPILDLVLPVHKEFANFIEYLLELDQFKRPTPEEALNHPFIKNEMAEN